IRIAMWIQVANRHYDPRTFGPTIQPPQHRIDLYCGRYFPLSELLGPKKMQYIVIAALQFEIKAPCCSIEPHFSISIDKVGDPIEIVRGKKNGRPRTHRGCD